MPLPKSKNRITLEEVGAPEYWVEFHLLAGMKFKDVKTLFGNNPDEDKTDEQYIEDMMEKLVIKWNLPEEDGGPVLPLPSKDISSVGKLPNSIVTYLVTEMAGVGEVPDTENLNDNS